MKFLHKLVENPALCSLFVAFIGSITAVLVAFIGWRSALNVANTSLQAESKRLMDFHKLEIYENAIEEINFLVPLYLHLFNDALDRHSPEEILSEMPSLRTTINTILDYQNSHNAIGKAQVYSEALKDYVPFIANPACREYIRQLDEIEKAGQDTSVDFSQLPEYVMTIYLVDELDKYRQCAEQLKKEIENLNFFER